MRRGSGGEVGAGKMGMETDHFAIVFFFFGDNGRSGMSFVLFYLNWLTLGFLLVFLNALHLIPAPSYWVVNSIFFLHTFSFTVTLPSFTCRNDPFVCP